MLQQLVESRHLPPLKSRAEMLDIVLREEFGYLPDLPFTMTVSEPTEVDIVLGRGECTLDRVDMTITTAYGSHTFPVHRLLHTDGKKRPFFVALLFHPEVPNRYYAPELIADNDVDVLSVCYQELTKDNPDFSDGLAGILLPNGQDTPHTCGKIALWSWGARRVMDYAQTLPQLDTARGAVIGHSRLGKTALLTGMTDERFRYICANDAGCAGDALCRGGLGVTGGTGKRGTAGEAIRNITATFGYWFNKNYARYADSGIPDEFDQHYLLACIAPRCVCVGSADLDDWADPDSQQLCCVAASEAWEREGVRGFIHEDRLLGADERLLDGNVGYHRRSGVHYLSYRDWLTYIDFIHKHK